VVEAEERPVVEEAEERPVVEEAEERPVVEEAEERPVVEEAEERPVVEEAEERGRLETTATTGPVAHLSESRRFGERIGALATAIRDGDVDAVLDELRTSSAEVVRTDADDLPSLLTERAVALRRSAESGDTARALEELDRHRLLCAHRDGPYGVSHWNRTVERLLMEATSGVYLRDWYVGRPFVVNTNDYGLSLWNGDTGVTCRLDGDLVAAIGDAGGSRLLPTSRLADVTTAHAMTVHRSQGSQFDELTVLLPEADSRILTRELLYTAVTRAKQRVRIVGTDDAIRAAVTRRVQRATGLASRLQG
jgi:exodeoxyribonuclease V alpha subunit